MNTSAPKAPLPTLENIQIAIIGLGYVGLPLALEFGKHYRTLGFDTSQKRVSDLRARIDRTRQITESDWDQSCYLKFCDDEQDLSTANIYIIAVPTPIDTHKVPDLSHLLHASAIVAKYLKRGDVVIYESTTYPTCTQNECANVLEQISHLKLNKDFCLGYSPERINPSDRTHTLTSIKKITSGSTDEAGKFIDKLYASIITAGTHLVSSIESAEMTKIIENAQRDLNIAFVNEIYIICEHLGINALEVLEAAKTKWNFLPFSPGLVGGHCISVDPYYLTHKMNAMGYHPQVISSGRLINDAMPQFVAQKIIKLMIQNRIEILNAQILILGITFKANCPDIRNSQIPIVKTQLEDFGAKVSIYDPLADSQEVVESYHISLLSVLPSHQFDVIFLAIAHDEFLHLSHNTLGKTHHIYYTLTPHKLEPLA